MQQWHPDKWTKSPELCGVAKRKFQQIQEAYSGITHLHHKLCYVFMVECKYKFKKYGYV